MAYEDAAKTKKIEVVVVTLSGEYSHKYDGDTLIEAVVQEAIKHLKLVADNTWVLELDGHIGQVEVFVRDHGDGFDLDDIPSDRFGVRESILGRVRRRGGTATVACKESGTEVHLVVPVGPCPPGAEAVSDEAARAVSEPQEKERTP